MLWVFEVVCVRVDFPASVITFVGNVTFSNASFKFSEVKPSLVILGKEDDYEPQNRQKYWQTRFVYNLSATTDNSSVPSVFHISNVKDKS